MTELTIPQERQAVLDAIDVLQDIIFKGDPAGSAEAAVLSRNSAMLDTTDAWLSRASLLSRETILFVQKIRRLPDFMVEEEHTQMARDLVDPINDLLSEISNALKIHKADDPEALAVIGLADLLRQRSIDQLRNS